MPGGLIWCSAAARRRKYAASSGTSSRRSRSAGTCTGKTTYLLAVNAPPDAAVHTLTLAPTGTAAYARATGDDAHDTRAAIRESRFAAFYYTGTPAAAKIRQHLGDSKAFDHRPFLGACDLVFVDGSHAYSYAVSDSAKAIEMVRPGGVVLWHDYRGAYRPRGVYRALNEMSRRVPLMHIAGTSLVAYRRPAALGGD